MSEDYFTDEDRRLEERMSTRIGVREPKREELFASGKAEKEPRPVKEIGGRYYAFEDDFISFLRGG
ncbi:hypothetical protein ATU3B_24540 [Agrobacterium genomosp. 3 str. CIP 111-78]|uniref:Uncharacterized protein n=1 Tax=Agrobacterium tumefaciens TaxID=358 RepID=A0AAE6EJM5_AGRTU|nr:MULTISPECIES: hypothetical protein [Agrobacterium tumefaciens complex]MCA2374799.1 hypothetical protein [Agrobacterium tomkonis CIP 111-78]QCM00213.1 hypothetical protein CFBP6624_08715 [Agrobacterium tumefaciens]